MEFKDILKSKRAEYGLTLDDVAHFVGVSGATVSRWESGEIANIRRDKIAKLSEILHVTPAYLMGWEEILRDTAEQMIRTEDFEKLPVEEQAMLLANKKSSSPEGDERDPLTAEIMRELEDGTDDEKRLYLNILRATKQGLRGGQPPET